ncbi:hypothetical protein B0H19DRAFT_946191, partial [Mycena capillaripes]
LSDVAHTVVGSTQILEALNTFLGHDPRSKFTVDPHYAFTYMLERSHSQSDVRFVFSALQLRLTRAGRHIESTFRHIRTTLMGFEFEDRLSSIDSTITEVRATFGEDLVEKEL